MPAEVLHIASSDDWAAALADGVVYRTASLDAEGFVHCSTAEQVDATLAGWFAGRTDLVLLRIDATALGDLLVFEPGSRGESQHFPHVYGPIPLTAVLSATPLAS